VGLFRPYERKESTSGDQISALTPKGQKAEEKARKAAAAPAADAVVEPAPDVQSVPRTPKKKDAPTPTRKQAQAARMERLHPTLTPKEQRKADRTERSPERQLARNFVDTRWTVAEFLMPVMILVMAGSMITLSMGLVAASNVILLSIWVLFAAAVIQTWFLWRGFKRLLAERHPNASTQGLMMYLLNRSMMLRRFRQPSPVIKRGDTF
jgi:cation transport ATPase